MYFNELHDNNIINSSSKLMKHKNEYTVSLSENNVCDLDTTNHDNPFHIVNNNDENSKIESDRFDYDLSTFTLPHKMCGLFTNMDYNHRSLNSNNSISSIKSIQENFHSLDNKKKNFHYFQKTSSSITLTEATREQYNDIWVGSINLKRTVKPNLENEYHRENSLQLSILEARNIVNKRRYYCDICLDRTLYARTTSKTSTSGIFWAEDFDLNNLPNVSVMTISLYRDAFSSHKDGKFMGTSRLSMKKYRKIPNQLVGFITIPVSEITGRTDIQMWLTLQPPLVNSHSNHDMQTNNLDYDQFIKNNSIQSSNSIKPNRNLLIHNLQLEQSNLPQLRIRARYKSLEILPISNYNSLRTLILEHSLLLTNWLECLLSIKMKEELASSLIYLHEHNGSLIDFLTNLVVREITGLANDSMAFRSNTIGTKAVECYVKFVGTSYLHNLLRPIIQRILACFNAWEVDPEKLSSSQCASGSLSVTDTAEFAITSSDSIINHRIPSGSLISNQFMLLRYLDIVWNAVQSSLNYFPNALTKLFTSFRKSVESNRGAEFCDNLISSCIFLRLVCPALLNPSLFGLISAYPSDPACQRNLTLLAKSLQTLANFSTFDDKEPYMRFLNGYVTKQMSNMRSFIRSISTNYFNKSININKHNPDSNYQDNIDEGYELANLYSILTELIYPQTDNSMEISNLINLNEINVTNNPNSIKYTNTNIETNQGVISSIPRPLICLPQTLSDITKTLTEINTVNKTNNMGIFVGAGAEKSEPENFLKFNFLQSSSDNDDERKLLNESKQKNTKTGYQHYRFNSCTPYYSLHHNPGFHNPLTGQKQETAQNVLIPEASLIKSLNSDSNSIVNDYDEPYISPTTHSETDLIESITSNNIIIQPVKNINRKNKLLTQSPTANQSTNHSSQIDVVEIKCEPIYSSLNKLDSQQERIYDSVPISGSSSNESMEQLEDKNNLFQNNDTEINQNLVQQKHLSIKKAILPTTSPRSQTLLVDESSCMNRLLKSNIELDNNKSLSPRMFQKQVTKANVILMKPRNSSLSNQTSVTITQSYSGDDNMIIDNGDKNDIYQNQQSCNHSGASLDQYDAQSSGNYHSILRNSTFPTSGHSQIQSNLSNSNDNISKYHEEEQSKSLPKYIRNDSLNSTYNNNSTNNPNHLTSEIIRLRHELLLTRQDAARAANRLSQQEAEINQLRQMLKQMKNNSSTPEFKSKSLLSQSLKTTMSSSLTTPITLMYRSQLKPNINNRSSNLENNLFINNYNSKLNDTNIVSTNSSPNNDGILQTSTFTPHTTITTSTFDELDDAMARLEQEQNELLHEQARIRARLAASRYHQPEVPFKSTSFNNKPATSNLKQCASSSVKQSKQQTNRQETVNYSVEKSNCFQLSPP